MTRERAAEIAVEAAARRHKATGQPAYYAEPFYPHEWVIDAIQEAAVEAEFEGYQTGVQEEQGG